jgi:Chloroplast import apparatus Tic20-like
MSWQSSETVADRFFGSLAYLLPIVNAHFFGGFIFEQFPILDKLYIPLMPLVKLDSGISGFILFFILYAGVAVNPRISRFIRFNVFQAILIGILLSLCRLLLQSVLPDIPSLVPITQVLKNTVFLGTLAIAGYGIIMSAFGKYTDIPQLSETARIQIDRY